MSTAQGHLRTIKSQSIGTEREGLQGHKISTVFYDVRKYNNVIIIHSNTKSHRVTR